MLPNYYEDFKDLLIVCFNKVTLLRKADVIGNINLRIRDGIIVAAKSRLTIFAVAVMFPIFMVCINLKAFWSATAMIMLFFSVRSLKDLVIANFASDSFFEKYECRQIEYNSVFAVLTDAILVCGAYALIMIMLFISFFLLESSVMKGFASLLLVFWAFDFYKVFSKPDESEDWTVVDTIKEVLMWCQSIGSIAFTILASFML